jgi:ABC-type antimicrobial peptide transport system permease subunit
LLRLLLTGSLRPVAWGLALGLVGSALIRPLLAGVVVGVPIVDLWTYGTTVTLVAALGACAIYLPARRLSGVDPVRALREV